MYHGFYTNGWLAGAGAFGAPWGGWLLVLAVAAAAAFAIAAFIRSGRTAARRDRPSALEILTERFARGEIDAETFRALKSELDS
ncbi:MAG: SHOCT domain-containing protein [Treponema sp.]|nr:SHOCT domain-containing protein [Treponema sp.]